MKPLQPPGMGVPASGLFLPHRPPAQVAGGFAVAVARLGAARTRAEGAATMRACPGQSRKSSLIEVLERVLASTRFTITAQ